MKKIRFLGSTQNYLRIQISSVNPHVRFKDTRILSKGSVCSDAPWAIFYTIQEENTTVYEPQVPRLQKKTIINLHELLIRSISPYDESCF